MEKVFPLTIQVTDRGLPAQLAQTRVFLTGTARAKKTGKNKAPKIKDSSIVSPIHISEADQVGLTVAMLEASDDDGDSLWWSIKEGNINQTFAVRSDSGALMLAKPIEYLPGDTKRLNLTQAVSDGELEDKKEIVIQLARSPTSRPSFTAQHYRTQFSEKTAIGTQIYTVKAVGEDVGPTTKPVLYTIFTVEDTGLEGKLRIEPSTGNVLVMESLDFEAGNEIHAIVQGRQGQFRNFATLTIGLSDDNDNSPQFSRKEEEVKVLANSPIGAVVTTLMANDVDSGDNGKIKYSIISGNELGFFALDSVSGVLTVKKSLNEAFGESILTVKATDSGKYPLSDTATIRIIPVSDQTGAFRFSRVVYHRLIRESTPIGSVILVVSTEPNGQAKYEMQQPCPYFEVHPLSGAVSLTKWLTRERAKSVECTLLAKSREGDVQDTAKIIIRPTNTNQHRPVFKQQVYRGFIRENAPSGLDQFKGSEGWLDAFKRRHKIDLKLMTGSPANYEEEGIEETSDVKMEMEEHHGEDGRVSADTQRSSPLFFTSNTNGSSNSTESVTAALLNTVEKASKPTPVASISNTIPLDLLNLLGETAEGDILNGLISSTNPMSFLSNRNPGYSGSREGSNENNQQSDERGLIAAVVRSAAVLIPDEEISFAMDTNRSYILTHDSAAMPKFLELQLQLANIAKNAASRTPQTVPSKCSSTEDSCHSRVEY